MKKLTNEDVDKRIKELIGDEYTRLSEYKGRHDNMLMKHLSCGYEYYITFGNISQGRTCPKCRKKELVEALSFDGIEVDKKIFDSVGNEYTRLGEYKNARIKFSIKHNICGHEYGVRWDCFRRGSRCPRCFGKNKLTNLDIDKKLFNLTQGEYIRTGEYKNARAKLAIKHKICGHNYEVAWTDFVSNSNRCPKCNESKGEKRISNLLKSLNIKYTSQKRFKDCKYKKTLPFDFYINNKNDKLLIEFDGIQHYKAISVFGGDKAFKETQLRDSIKNKFAQDNNIPLLRISYLEEEDVENIVMNKLKELNFI